MTRYLFSLVGQYNGEECFSRNVHWDIEQRDEAMPGHMQECGEKARTVPRFLKLFDKLHLKLGDLY